MRKKFLLAILICIILGLIALGYHFWRPQKNPRLVLYGNVDVRQVDIGFRVAGQVEELFFEEGELVKKGELLARLDRTPYNSQILQAKAQIASTEANLDNAEKLLKRRQELIGVQGVSQEDLDNVIASRNVQLANLEVAKANLVIAEDNLRYTEAFAPTDGVILTRIREPGTVVNPANPVYVLSVASPVWVRAYVSEPELGMVFFGQEAEIYLDMPEAPIYQGKVGFISPVAEFTPKTVQTTELRTDLVYRLRIYIDHPDGILKQGMPVTVKLQERDGAVY